MLSKIDGLVDSEEDNAGGGMLTLDRVDEGRVQVVGDLCETVRRLLVPSFV
jgi:hypothetical protein